MSTQPLNEPSSSPERTLRTQPRLSEDTDDPAAEFMRRKQRRNPTRVIVLLFILAIVSLGEPRVYQWVLKQVIRLEGWRHGIRVYVGRVEGSIFDPVVLVNSHWIYDGRDGGTTRVEIRRATATFDWRSLRPHSNRRWFQQLELDGITGKIHFPRDGERASASEQERPGLHFRVPDRHVLPLPQVIDAKNIDFMLQSGEDYVRFQDSRILLSRSDRGEVEIGRLIVHQPWLERTFTNVRGTTAIDEGDAAIAQLTIAPDVEVQYLAANLGELAAGRLDVGVRALLFGGTVRAEARTEPKANGHFLESSATFAQIDIAKLAEFIGESDAAAGIINEGKLVFRGRLRAADEAEMSLGFRATNFRWDARQWDSLVVGATLLNRAVQVHQCDLQQGANQVSAAGELTLPEPGESWWKGQFDFRVNGVIKSLAELSALLLPEFEHVAGEVAVNGTVRGRNQQFNGQLTVSGSDLEWRTAPIQRLAADVRFMGSSIEVTRLELANRGDFVRGQGVLQLGDAPKYAGQLRASVIDLAVYEALLRPPILPEPLTGGAVIDWTGQGSGSEHTGKFTARLRRVGTLGALAERLHPIDANLEGTYAPGKMQFSQFHLADEDSAFTANVAVGDRAIHFADVRFEQNGVVALQGEALLPLDVWQRWPEVSLDKLLTDQVASRVKLSAEGLKLEELSELTGWRFPIAGTVNGSLTAKGAAKALELGGKLTISNGRLPLGAAGDHVEDMTAELAFSGSGVRVERMRARHKFGALEMDGAIELKPVTDPQLELNLRSELATVPLFRRISADNDAILAAWKLDLRLEGPLSRAKVKGDAKLTAPVIARREIDLATLWGEVPGRTLPPVFSFPASPWADWEFDIAAHMGSPVAIEVLTAQSWRPPLDAQSIRHGAQSVVKVTGTGTAPRLEGTLEFSELSTVPKFPTLPAVIGDVSLSIRSARVEFRPEATERPSVDVTAVGNYYGEPYEIQLAGPLMLPIRTIRVEPPLTVPLIAERLANAQRDNSQFPRFSLRMLSPAARHVTVLDWAKIEDPPADATIEHVNSPKADSQ